MDDLYEYAKNPDVGILQGWKPHESKEESLAALRIYIADEEMKIDLLTAFHIPQNTRSKRVIERCGFQYETTIKQGKKIYIDKN